MKQDFIEYMAQDTDDGVKLYSILRNRLNLSRRLITSLKKNNGIFLNGNTVYTNAKVSTGDKISINILKEESQDIEPEEMPLEIVFEDNDLSVVNKQPGIVVHPTKGHPQGTLSNGIIYHWRNKGEDTIVRLVNRLDRDTSGLIIIAKNQFSHQAMAKQLEANIVEKVYYAVVHGNLPHDEGTIDLPIDRPSYDSIKRTVMKEGQKAVTHYKVVERYRDADLLKIILETGKTHQIRVHLSHIGHPLYGDTLYGISDDYNLIQRQALHAYMLVFNHPRSGERLNLKAELPGDMVELINKLNKSNTFDSLS